MQVNRQEWIIELSARRITAHKRGRAPTETPITTDVNAKQTAQDHREHGEGYNTEAIATALRNLVTTHGLTGATAHIIYDLGPGTTNLVSCPTTLQPVRARAAAELAAEEHAADHHDAVFTICDIGKDRAPNTNSQTNQPRRHTLVIADRDETLDSLREIIEHAGLKQGWFVPASAVHAAKLARHAQSSEGPGIDVIIGWRTTVLATHRAGRLVSIRTLSAGVETMLNAINTDDPAYTLTKLIETTNPAELRSTTGQQLIPKVAPVLQRLGVELKQSLRLGITDADRANTVVTIWATPGRFDWLPSTFATFIEVETRSGKDPVNAAAEWCETGVGRLGLLPRATLASRRSKRTLAALWCGAIAATGLLASDLWMTRAEINAERDRIAAVAAVRTEAESLVAHRDAAMQAVERQRVWSETIDKALGEVTDIAGVLHALAISTPEPVRFEGLDIERDAQQRLVCRLRGRVVAQGVAAAGALGDFIAAARSSPMIADASIRHVERVATRESRHNQQPPNEATSASRFEIEIIFVTTPYTVATNPFNAQAITNIASAETRRTGDQ